MDNDIFERILKSVGVVIGGIILIYLIIISTQKEPRGISLKIVLATEFIAKGLFYTALVVGTFIFLALIIDDYHNEKRIKNETVDFNRGTIDLSETIIWIKGKPHHVKGTKTNNPNKKIMTPLIREILLELKKERPAGCKFFFHHKGKVFRYQMIREELNKALIQSGYRDYSGTHILPHSMSSYSRKESELDTTWAMQNWM